MSVSSRPKSMPAWSLSSPLIDPNASYTGRRKPSRDMTAMSIHGQQIKSPPRKPVPRHETRQDSPTCDFATLVRQPYFAAHHVHYSCTDRVLGVVFCQLAVDNRSIYAHVFSSAGSAAFTNLELPQHTAKVVVNSASQAVSQAHNQALTVVFQQYFSAIPENARRLIQARARTMVDPQYITKLANSMELIKNNGLTNSLLSFLAPKFSRSVLVNVVAPRDGLLRSILPKAVVVRDNDADISKFPPPPMHENIEKRENLIHEILATERTYVSRLQHLLKDYAAPLRAAARKQKGILGVYETNNLFPTSLDAIVLLHQDFLKQLEGSSGDYQFALTLVNGFRDFRKVYARYLDTSSDLDQILRDALKMTKFKEYTDQVRTSANAKIGIRELVMEPISRIPRYSLLISSLLQVITPSNPAYPVFKEALVLVRRIGYMERDRAETSQETLMKLSTLVSSWPSELVKSSVSVLGFVDCLDMTNFGVPSPAQASGSDGNPCSLVLLSDRLVILKRNRGARLDDVLQSAKKGELGYRGFVMIDSLKLLEGDDCLYAIFDTEVSGVISERWTKRSFRKFALLASDANRFVHQFQQADIQGRSCEKTRCVDTYNSMSIRYAVYNPEEWSNEIANKKRNYTVMEGTVETGSESSPLFSATLKEGTWSCHVKLGSQTSFLCRDVSLSILKDSLLDKIVRLQEESWMNITHYTVETILEVHADFARTLLASVAVVASPMKSRPTSPSKIMSSFLGKRDKEVGSLPTTTRRPETSGSERSFASHTIVKKKSNQLFSFGSEDRSFSGIDTFLESVVLFDHFPTTDFGAANATETKQINALVSLISKDPKKGFAILGSPSKVALHAFRNYCRNVVFKKLPSGCIIPDPICQSLRSHLKYQQETKKNRLRSILSTLPAQNFELLRSILRCGLHIQASSEEASTVKCLLLLSEMLVSSLSVTGFISTLEVLLHDYEDLFFASSEIDMNTLTSVTSGMSLHPVSSRFGSLSSQSFSNYLTEPSTSSTFSASPAKISDFENTTPDLMNGLSSPEETASLVRSLSGTSLVEAHSPDLSKKYKRATVDASYPFSRNNIFGFSSSESHLVDLPLDKLLPAPPKADHDMLRSVSDQLMYRKPPRFAESSGGDLQARETSPVRSVLNEPRAPFVNEDIQSSKGVVPSTASLALSIETRLRTPPRRVLTPSKIPVPSPQLKQDSPYSTPTHSRQSSTAGAVTPITSRKESNIPRLPSTLARKRENHGITRTFSEHSFTFDTEMSDNLNLALQYTDHVSEVSDDEDMAVSLPPENELRMANRENARREITSASRITSASTIRRVSRQLQKTDVGPLEVPLPAVPSMSEGIRNFSGHGTPVDLPPARNNVGCSSACKERVELLHLELLHYRELYRQSAEEVDVTIDVANEQIAELQSALQKGSLEATALGLLELEKEKNRKLLSELAILREQMH